MTGGLLAAVVAVVVLVLVAAALAVGETALTRVGRARAEAMAGDGEPGAVALVELLHRRDRALSPLLLLRVVCHLSIAAVVAVVVVDRYGVRWVPAAVVAEVVIVHVVAEAMPRTWALLHVDDAARRVAPWVRGILRVAPLRWASRTLDAVANALVPGPARPPVVTEDEVIALTEAAAASDEIDPEERELIESVFALGDTIVREVMVPRTDMVTVEATATITDALDLGIHRGLSRLPVSGDGVDDIVGLALTKELARAERAGDGDRPVGSVMRRPYFVPETKHADDLLREMQAGRRHLAVVVDEYGGTAGLVTLEDLVEELVGEIVDEFDVEEPLVSRLAGGEALVHGRMPVDQLNELVEAEIEEGDWDTVGGLIFNTLGHVPDVGESIEEGGVRLRVEAMEGRRITRVRLTPVHHG